VPVRAAVGGDDGGPLCVPPTALAFKRSQSARGTSPEGLDWTMSPVRPATMWASSIRRMKFHQTVRLHSYADRRNSPKGAAWHEIIRFRICTNAIIRPASNAARRCSSFW